MRAAFGSVLVLVWGFVLVFGLVLLLRVSRVDVVDIKDIEFWEDPLEMLLAVCVYSCVTGAEKEWRCARIRTSVCAGAGAHVGILGHDDMLMLTAFILADDIRFFSNVHTREERKE